jgi:hypothetical protein
MPEFTPLALTELLVKRHGYDAADANGMVPELMAMQPAVKAAFLKWWETGILPEEPKYENYSALSLAVAHNLQPVAAFLTLDWLAVDPETAIEAIKGGYDQVFTEKGKRD